MIEVEPGHRYDLQVLDHRELHTRESAVVRLAFVKRTGLKYPGNENEHPGTTLQEVLRACVARLIYVNNQLPNEHTHLARLNIEGAIFELESRAAELAKRDAGFSIHEAVYGTTCSKCGHIQCKGECHAENSTSRSSNLRQGTRTRNKSRKTR